ncbi:pilus assembly protein TadG-related protein [Pseudomonas sp. F3-2]|uniref:pilus assembly protein TadG-related protein n=1 Tax=Pseudomonas sp. F3-2 TaxID=3141539 RepID=UPI00315D5CB7
MSPLMYCGPRRDRQRGAIGLLAALTMALALMFMLVVIDSGRLFLEKRNLQRVADMAALEAASLFGACSGGNTATGYATQSATRNGFTVSDNTRSMTTRCGTLTSDANSRRVFTADASKADAIQVIVSHTVARSIAAGIGALFDSEPTPADIQLSAVAVATPPLPPLAQLTINSTLATVDSTQAGLLNTLWGGLLGGTLNISAAGWNGLANANINLLNYLDRLALDINAKAGDYTSLLATNISIKQLLSTAATVLPQNDSAVQVALNGLGAVNTIASGTTIKLQNLLNLQTGLPSAGLNTNLNVFGLVQGFVQVANSNSALYATVPANVLGLVGLTTKVKIVEASQLSAAGDPRLATANSNDPNQIYVRTAQVRTLTTVDLSSLGPALNLASSTISLLLALLNADVQIAPAPLTLDISLEAASANSHVTGFTCASDATKTLAADTNTALIKLKIGKIDGSVWSSSLKDLPSPQELVLLNVRTGTPRVDFGGGGAGLMVNLPVAANRTMLNFTAPAQIGAPPSPVLALNGDPNIVTKLGTGLNNPLVLHTASNSGLLGAVLNLVTGAINVLVSTVTGLLGTLIGPLLDPLLNIVLKNLGVNIANVNVGANLSCHPAQAVLVI